MLLLYIFLHLSLSGKKTCSREQWEVNAAKCDDFPITLEVYNLIVSHLNEPICSGSLAAQDIDNKFPGSYKNFCFFDKPNFTSREYTPCSSVKHLLIREGSPYFLDY